MLQRELLLIFREEKAVTSVCFFVFPSNLYMKHPKGPLIAPETLLTKFFSTFVKCELSLLHLSLASSSEFILSKSTMVFLIICTFEWFLEVIVVFSFSFFIV